MGYENTMTRRDETAIFFDAGACPLPTVIACHAYDPGKTQTMDGVKI